MHSRTSITRILKLLLKMRFYGLICWGKKLVWAMEREFLFLRTRSILLIYNMNLSPISSIPGCCCIGQMKVGHFCTCTYNYIPICATRYLYIWFYYSFFRDWSAIYQKMRLSVVFELLLIFLIIAFAAYGRVGKSEISSVTVVFSL